MIIFASNFFSENNNQ